MRWTISHLGIGTDGAGTVNAAEALYAELDKAASRTRDLLCRKERDTSRGPPRSLAAQKSLARDDKSNYYHYPAGEDPPIWLTFFWLASLTSSMKADVSLPSSGHPNWVRVWMGLLGLWVTFAVLGTWFNYQAFFVRARPISWVEAIRMNVVAYGIWALLLTPVVLFLCAKLPLAKKELFKLIPAHVVAIAGVVCVDVCIKTLLGGRVFPGAQSHPFAGQFHRYFYSEAEADIQIYLLIAVVGYVVAYYSELRRQERHAAELETNLIGAELQVLKMQLQPHFLFNTLHSVAALVRTNPRAAEKMICSLGDLLRMTLAVEDLPKVTLRRELEFLQMYLDIQRVRFQDRLIAEIDVAEEVLDATVPYLLLQPLVENAIKYGIARRPGLGKIEIHIRRENDDVKISVMNDNSSSDPVPDHARLGIGLENIRGRLRILYDSKGRLTIQELSGGRYQVEVQLPFESVSVAESSQRPVAAEVRPALGLGA